MHESIKVFLKDPNNPNILNEYYEDVYMYYALYTIKRQVVPVSKNKFSREIKKWGFETKVCRDPLTHDCKRMIILPNRILEEVQRAIYSKNA